MKNFKKSLLMMGLALGLVNMPAKADYKNAVVPGALALLCGYLALNSENGRDFTKNTAVGLLMAGIAVCLAKKS